MKLKLINGSRARPAGWKGNGIVGGATVPAAWPQIAALKAALFRAWSPALNSQTRLLHLALNEAEATAWQTQFPQLLFPALAAEKVQAVIAWETRQQSVRRASREFPRWVVDREFADASQRNQTTN